MRTGNAGEETGEMNPPTVGGKFVAKDVGGRRPRRPAEGSRPLPTMQKIKGIQWQGCGPGMPGPYGVAWMSCGRRPAPRNVVKWDVGRPAPRPPRTFALMRCPADCCRGGRRPRRPRRGQDPSLRCKGYRGGNGEAAGRACPAPTDCRKRVADERGEGGRQPGPFSRAEVAREWAATHSPSESPSPLTRPAPFDKGASTSPLRGFGGTPEF